MPQAPAIERLIFVHLGRTGGTTMRQKVIYNCVDPACIYVVGGNESHACGGSMEQLLAMPRNKQEKLRVVVGHMPFGLREQLPWPETWHYVTFVREPISRTVSEYYQVRHSAGNPAHAAGHRWSLEEFVRRGYGLSWNGMSRMLSNECYGKTFPSLEAMYQEAVRNADSCSFIGMIESYDESIRRLCRLCAWKMPAIEARNSHTPKGLELGDREREVIRAVNTFDQALYEHCRERFAKEHRNVPANVSLQRFKLRSWWPFSRPLQLAKSAA